MDGGAWFISIVVLIGLVAALALTYLPIYALWRAHAHARRIGLGLPAPLERGVSSRLMSRERGSSIGGIIFTVIAVAAFHFEAGNSNDSDLTALFIIGSVFAGVGTGAAVAALTGSNRVAPERARIARSGAVSVSDFLAPLERIGARVVVTVAVVALIGSTIVAMPGERTSQFAIAFFAIFGAIYLALFEIMSRRIVERPQPAGSTAELVWDDAIRATSLRDLVTAPLALGSYCLIFGAIEIAENGTDPRTVAAAYTAAAIFAIAVLVLGIVSIATRPHRHFIERLWPDLRPSDTANVATNAA
jgi:hypothetical protein